MKRSAHGLERDVREAGRACRKPVSAGESHALGAGEPVSDGAAVVCTAGEGSGVGMARRLRLGSTQSLGGRSGEEISYPCLTLRDAATGSCVPAPCGPLTPHQLMLGHQGLVGGPVVRADGCYPAPGGLMSPSLLAGPAGNQRQQAVVISNPAASAGIVRPGTALAGASVDDQVVADPSAAARCSHEHRAEVRTGASVVGSRIRQTCPAGMTLELVPCGPSQGSGDLVSTPHAGFLPAGEHSCGSVEELPELRATDGSSEGSEVDLQPISGFPGFGTTMDFGIQDLDIIALQQAGQLPVLCLSSSSDSECGALPEYAGVAAVIEMSSSSSDCCDSDSDFAASSASSSASSSSMDSTSSVNLIDMSAFDSSSSSSASEDSDSSWEPEQPDSTSQSGAAPIPTGIPTSSNVNLASALHSLNGSSDTGCLPHLWHPVDPNQALGGPLVEPALASHVVSEGCDLDGIRIATFGGDDAFTRLLGPVAPLISLIHDKWQVCPSFLNVEDRVVIQRARPHIVVDGESRMVHVLATPPTLKALATPCQIAGTDTNAMTQGKLIRLVWAQGLYIDISSPLVHRKELALLAQAVTLAMHAAFFKDSAPALTSLSASSILAMSDKLDTWNWQVSAENVQAIAQPQIRVTEAEAFAAHWDARMPAALSTVATEHGYPLSALEEHWRTTAVILSGSFGAKKSLRDVAALLAICCTPSEDFTDLCFYDTATGKTNGVVLLFDLSANFRHADASQGLGAGFTKMRTALQAWQERGITMSRAVRGDRSSDSCLLPVKSFHTVCDVYGRVFSSGSPALAAPEASTMADILRRCASVNWYCPGHTYIDRRKYHRDSTDSALMPDVKTLLSRLAIGLSLDAEHADDSADIAQAGAGLLHHVRARLGSYHRHYFRVECRVSGPHVAWMAKLMLEHAEHLKQALCNEVLVSVPSLDMLDAQLLAGAEKLLGYIVATPQADRHKMSHQQLAALRGSLMCLAFFMWHGDMDPPKPVRGVARVNRRISRARGWITLNTSAESVPFVGAALDSSPEDLRAGKVRAVARYVYGILTAVKCWRPGPALAFVPHSQHVSHAILRDAASIFIAAHWCAMFARSGGSFKRTKGTIEHRSWYIAHQDWCRSLPVTDVNAMGVNHHGLWTCAKAVMQTVDQWTVQCAAAASESGQQLVFMPTACADICDIASQVCAVWEQFIKIGVNFYHPEVTRAGGAYLALKALVKATSVDIEDTVAGAVEHAMAVRGVYVMPVPVKTLVLHSGSRSPRNPEGGVPVAPKIKVPHMVKLLYAITPPATGGQLPTDSIWEPPSVAYSSGLPTLMDMLRRQMILEERLVLQVQLIDHASTLAPVDVSIRYPGYGTDWGVLKADVMAVAAEHQVRQVLDAVAAEQKQAVQLAMQGAVQSLVLVNLVDSSGNLRMPMIEAFVKAGQDFTAGMAGRSRPASTATLHILAVSVSVYCRKLQHLHGIARYSAMEVAVVAAMKEHPQLRSEPLSRVREALRGYWQHIKAFM